jgi:hypothetical protein
MAPLRRGNCWPDAEQKWLLQACLFPQREAEKAWNSWLKLVDIENLDPASLKLLPLAYRNLSNLKGPVLDRCRGYYRKTWLQNQLNWKEVKSSLDPLVERGIQVVLLKGMAMILAYYEDLGARTIGDIDILVRTEDLPIVQKIFKQNGLRQSNPRFDLQDKQQIARWHAISFLDEGGRDIDLHWSFIHEHSPLLDQAVLRQARALNSYFIPSPTHLFLQTCIHGAKFSPIPLIRWVADAVTLLKRASIEWDELVYLVKEAHIALPMVHALEYLAEEFDAPIPSAVTSSLRSLPVHRLMIAEYKASSKGSSYLTDWYRFCINRQFWNRGQQALSLFNYLQVTALLKSPWKIPSFAILWIFRRVKRRINPNFRTFVVRWLCSTFFVFLVRNFYEG